MLRARKNASLLEKLLPGQLEKALAQAGPAKLTRELRGLVGRAGDPARQALHALLCDKKGGLRQVVDTAMQGGTASAIAVIVPLLVAQFALAPAVALAVASLVVRLIAAKGHEKLCAELAESTAALRRKPARRPAAKRPPARRPARRK